MACYHYWEEGLERGSAQHQEQEARLLAQLESVLHIIDYYYDIAGEDPPEIRDPGPMHGRNCGRSRPSLPEPSARFAGEARILSAITHHMACDGIWYPLLWDLASLLPDDAQGHAYRRIVLACAYELRLHGSWYPCKPRHLPRSEQPRSPRPQDGTTPWTRARESGEHLTTWRVCGASERRRS